MDPYPVQEMGGLDMSSPGTTKVFIGNVAWSTTNETLSEYLHQQGVHRRSERAPRGFGSNTPLTAPMPSDVASDDALVRDPTNPWGKK